MQEKLLVRLPKILARIILMILVTMLAGSGNVIDQIGILKANFVGMPLALATEETAVPKGDTLNTFLESQTTFEPLSKGDMGEAVLQMKQRLCELGYFLADEISEVYDDTTAERIALFQEMNDLESTGHADAETLACLFSEDAQMADADHRVYAYILNTNTKKFHYPDCSSVKQIKDKNKQAFNGTRGAVIGKGYSPCGNCHP